VPDSERYAPQYKSALGYANMVCSDLSRIEHIDFTPHTSLDDTLTISETSENDIAPYGLAMWLALSNKDAENQAIFSMLYNQKRLTAPRTQYKITQTYKVMDAAVTE
jgi:hypothetical protein